MTLKSANTPQDFFGSASSPGELDRHLPLQESLKDELRKHLSTRDSPYLEGKQRLIEDSSSRRTEGGEL